MKIILNQDPSFPETEVTINCHQADEDILRLVAMLRIHQKKLVGTLEGEQHLLDVRDILYIDTVDKRTFLYTGKAVYESALRLYELEEGLRNLDRALHHRQFLPHPVDPAGAGGQAAGDGRQRGAAVCIPPIRRRD